MITDRSGATLTPVHTLTEVEWTRNLDDTSTARVVVQPDGDCCERLGEVRAWRSYLNIWRDGVPVWSGPVLQVEWSLGKIEIWAGDLLAWLDRRVPHQDITFGGSDLTDIAEWLITDGFAPDDPGHEIQILGRSGVRGGRKYLRNVGQTGDHLRDLAETGLDYTAVGSRIVLMPENHTVSVGRLSDADLPEGLIVAEDGTALGTRWVVAGDDEGDVLGEAGGADPYYGLLERYVEQTTITTDAAATEAAKSRLRSSLPVPVFIDTQDVTISPDAAVEVPLLVPGWCLDITTQVTCRPISQRLKIVGLKVAEDGGTESTPGSEQVQVQVAATGSDTATPMMAGV
ncbi:hypothetical protein HUT18_11475 [Streptomyces sp. NA04227]|uniref:hypothetical protein n=1 Tax=Streptomyces sp. NA04227 TaxID=2742136 RepID=UPI00159279E1|nr:hypothetical protein [Streptomyces sp. NA04227]QKW06919.1 hypothetical protein HUT18_11475 [Streptomyces sp. NA04227]